MPDPRFREAVVLVTQAPDASTVGVILNRRLNAKLSDYMADPREGSRPVFHGGPVMQRVIVALFRAAEPPAAPAFEVLRGIYLGMHPGAIAPQLAAPEGAARFFAGFAGWAPGQLAAELKADAWHVLPASAELLFRTDLERLWPELVEKARAFRTRTTAEPGAILVP